MGHQGLSSAEIKYKMHILQMLDWYHRDCHLSSESKYMIQVPQILNWGDGNSHLLRENVFRPSVLLEFVCMMDDEARGRWHSSQKQASVQWMSDDMSSATNIQIYWDCIPITSGLIVSGVGPVAINYSENLRGVQTSPSPVRVKRVCDFVLWCIFSHPPPPE